MKEKKFTNAQVIEAMEATGGFITYTAEVLGCNYETVARYLRNDPELKAVQQHIKENRLDIAESVVMKKLKEDNLEAAKYYLKYMGRSRGYIKATQLEITDDLSKLMEAAENRTK